MNRLPAPRPAPREDDRTPRWRERDTGLVTTAGLVTLGFLAALSINVLVLPDTHIISSLYLLPVLVACHRWRPSVVAATAVIATALYVATAHLEQRPLSVWPFGVLALLIGGYLTVRFAKQRQDIARLARREAEDRRHLQTFIGMVAHDLAGAMTNVLVGAAMLDGIRQAEASAEERIAITAIDGGTHQMQRLLDDLRDASAIGAGKFRVQPVMMDLVTVLAETVEQQRARNPLHRITLAAPNHVQGAWWLSSPSASPSPPPRKSPRGASSASAARGAAHVPPRPRGRPRRGPIAPRSSAFGCWLLALGVSSSWRTG